MLWWLYLRQGRENLIYNIFPLSAKRGWASTYEFSAHRGRSALNYLLPESNKRKKRKSLFVLNALRVLILLPSQYTNINTQNYINTHRMIHAMHIKRTNQTKYLFGMHWEFLCWFLFVSNKTRKTGWCMCVHERARSLVKAREKRIETKLQSGSEIEI